MSDDYSYNSEESIKARALEKKREDTADFYNEIAGRDSGRMTRFLTSEERERRNKNPSSHKRINTVLDTLLMSPNYQAQYDATMATLVDTEDIVHQALIAAADRIRETRTAMEDITSRAASLPDGRKAFRTRDGKVYSDDGKELNAADIALITWPDDAPSWEDYIGAQNAHDEARTNHSKLDGYQSEVDHIRTHMEDPKNPPSMEDLEKYKQRLDDIRRDAKSSFNAEAEFEIDRTQGQTTAPDLDLDAFKL